MSENETKLGYVAARPGARASATKSLELEQ
jgi:hypothetical protein